MAMVLNQTLRRLCFKSGWTYAVFWKLKRRSRMVLTWEDGYYENSKSASESILVSNNCTQVGGDSIRQDSSIANDQIELYWAKMSYHVYSLGEGIIGRVAFTGKHQWVFGAGEKGNSTESYATSRLNGRSMLEKLYPVGWQQQFSAGVKTIAVVAVPQGVVQLGSTQTIMEDLNLVGHVRALFGTLQSVPGAFLSDYVPDTHGGKASGQPCHMVVTMPMLMPPEESSTSLGRVYMPNGKMAMTSNSSSGPCPLGKFSPSVVNLVQTSSMPSIPLYSPSCTACHVNHIHVQNKEILYDSRAQACVSLGVNYQDFHAPLLPSLRPGNVRLTSTTKAESRRATLCDNTSPIYDQWIFPNSGITDTEMLRLGKQDITDSGTDESSVGDTGFHRLAQNTLNTQRCELNSYPTTPNTLCRLLEAGTACQDSLSSINVPLSSNVNMLRSKRSDMNLKCCSTDSTISGDAELCSSVHIGKDVGSNASETLSCYTRVDTVGDLVVPLRSPSLRSSLRSTQVFCNTGVSPVQSLSPLLGLFGESVMQKSLPELRNCMVPNYHAGDAGLRYPVQKHLEYQQLAGTGKTCVSPKCWEENVSVGDALADFYSTTGEESSLQQDTKLTSGEMLSSIDSNRNRRHGMLDLEYLRLGLRRQDLSWNCPSLEMQFAIGDELSRALGPGFKKDYKKKVAEDCIAQHIGDDGLITPIGQPQLLGASIEDIQMQGIENLDLSQEFMLDSLSSKDVFGESKVEPLLDAMVTGVSSVSRGHCHPISINKNFVTSTSCCGLPINVDCSRKPVSNQPLFGRLEHGMPTLSFVCTDTQDSGPLQNLCDQSDQGRLLRKSSSELFRCGSSTAWVGEGNQNTSEEGASLDCHLPLKRHEESGKFGGSRKKPKAGETPRPRPKDRQQIQDRVKELRDIVPNANKNTNAVNSPCVEGTHTSVNGRKSPALGIPGTDKHDSGILDKHFCSIDSLLEKTVKHMQFLQSVTKQGGSWKQFAELKNEAIRSMELGRSEVKYPIVVESLSQPRQMLIKMLCEERGLFLEIADAVRGLGLTILNGIMEVHNGKLWAHLVVEDIRDTHRVDVLWSLRQLILPNLKVTSTGYGQSCPLGSQEANSVSLPPVHSQSFV